MKIILGIVYKRKDPAAAQGEAGGRGVTDEVAYSRCSFCSFHQAHTLNAQQIHVLKEAGHHSFIPNYLCKSCCIICHALQTNPGL